MKPLPKSHLLKAALCLSSFSLYGQSAFSPGIRYGAVSEFPIPQSVAVADINGDGKPDIITGNLAGSLTIMTNDGKGNFALFLTIPEENPSAMICADINGDGKMDLICAEPHNDTLMILTNAGNGVFAISSTPTVGDSPHNLIAVDVNNDGKLDLVTVNYIGTSAGGTLSVLTNDGTGNFVVASSPSITGIYSIAAADVNEDGKIDLITAGVGYINVLTNSGNGIFKLSSTPYSPGAPQAVVAADVNGDGHIDLITANALGDTVGILTNDGKGHFVLASAPSVIGGPYSLAVGDINGDGKPDLVVGTRLGSIYTNGVTVLTNDGSGNFTIATKMFVDDPWAEAIADLNADGKPDIVVADPGVNQIAVFFQVPQLSIASQLSNAVVSWPASWTNWVLQENTNLSTTNWLTTTDILNDGTNNTASVPLSCSNLFFRLIPP